eukprot:365517-Chlamydomonas_euryale.AAC.5
MFALLLTGNPVVDARLLDAACCTWGMYIFSTMKTIFAGWHGVIPRGASGRVGQPGDVCGRRKRGIPRPKQPPPLSCDANAALARPAAAAEIAAAP